MNEKVLLSILEILDDMDLRLSEIEDFLGQQDFVGANFDKVGNYMEVSDHLRKLIQKEQEERGSGK